MVSNPIGSYTLDSLQIFFAWDDDLYTRLKERGFGQGGFQRKTLPIIYSDNCESTTGVTQRRRKYVIHPKYFGRTCEELGWTQTDKETEPIISSEKPKITVSLVDDDFLEFRINPAVNGKEQYHLEYSTMSAFGRLYTNWSIPILRINDFRAIVAHLQHYLSLPRLELADLQVRTEEKQAQRERMYYVEVPVASYKFSMGEFAYARDFFALNGVSGIIPSLVFKNIPSHLEKMQPFLKVGYVQTSKEQGFEVRKPQCAMKLAQPKVTTSLRGKRSKAKGMIIEEEPYENYLRVPARVFAQRAHAILNIHSSAQKKRN